MANKHLQARVSQALKSTRTGLQLLIEADELYARARGLERNTEFQRLVEAMMEKQKLAVVLIQEAMQIEKDLLQDQATSIKELGENL